MKGWYLPWLVVASRLCGSPFQALSASSCRLARRAPTATVGNVGAADRSSWHLSLVPWRTNCQNSEYRNRWFSVLI
jgi:hypothetical protein